MLHIKSAVALCTAILSGCAVGGFGTVAAEVQRREMLSVLSVHSIGLHVRTRADDPGAAFGYSKRVYLFAADETLSPGWHFFSVPSPAADAFAQDLLTIGIDLSPAAPEAGVSLGYAHTRLHARLPSNGCSFIKYAGSDLQIKSFTNNTEDEECDNY